MDHVPGRDALDLLLGQVEGITAWVAEQRGLAVEEVVAASREMRLDAERRLQARRREQAAVLARADAHLRASGELLRRTAPARAVVAHRSPWVRQRLARELESGGMTVAAVLEDGADAMGAVVVEQPELLLVEDRLTTVSGVDLVRRARVLAPATLVAVHAGDGSALVAARDVGAGAVFARAVPPAVMAEELLRLLAEGRATAPV